MSSDKTQLIVSACSRKSARYAVQRWHYTRSMPCGKLTCFGAWECERYVGAVIFGRGANNHIGSPWGLEQTSVCELVRVALTDHKTPTSKIVARSLRGLSQHCPGIKLVVSYADPEQGHAGILYQALNFIYIGKSAAQRETIVNGKETHKRVMTSRLGTIKGLKAGPIRWKHKYVYPFDSDIRALVLARQRPYPKCAGSIDSDASVSQTDQGGAIPTSALQ